MDDNRSLSKSSVRKVSDEKHNIDLVESHIQILRHLKIFQIWMLKKADASSHFQ